MLVSDHGELLYSFIFLFIILFYTPFGHHCRLSNVVVPAGSANQKGTVMGILRSLGALARALGPVVCSSGKETQLAPNAPQIC